MEFKASVRLRMIAKGFCANGEMSTAHQINQVAQQVEDEIKHLEDKVSKMDFMIANGLGWDDMKGGNIEDVS